MGRVGARARPSGLSVVLRWRKGPQARKGMAMRTRAKAASVGPAAVIVAASSRLPSTGLWRNKRKENVFRRSAAAAPEALGRARRAVKQLERAAAVLGAVATGLELIRGMRIAGSSGTQSRGHSLEGSTPRSSPQASPGRPASKTTRVSTSTGVNTASKSAVRATKKPSGKRKKGAKKRRGRTTAAKRSRSRTTAKKAGGARTIAKKQARSRATAKSTGSPRRTRSAARR
jgi:hypothetical protein